MNGRVMSKEAFDRRFSSLPALPTNAFHSGSSDVPFGERRESSKHADLDKPNVRGATHLAVNIPRQSRGL